MCEKGFPTLHVEMPCALCIMLERTSSWHEKLQKDLEEDWFVFNAYNPCIANELTEGSQMTVRLHIDNLMSSHKKPSVNDKFLKFLNKKCGQCVEVKATRGK